MTQVFYMPFFLDYSAYLTLSSLDIPKLSGVTSYQKVFFSFVTKK